MSPFDERLLDQICERCKTRLWCHLTPITETPTGYLCANCLRDRKPLYHSELLAILDGDTTCVRGELFRVYKDRIERV